MAGVRISHKALDRIEQLSRHGLNSREIAERLTAEGVLNTDGVPEWSRNRIIGAWNRYNIPHHDRFGVLTDGTRPEPEPEPEPEPKPRVVLGATCHQAGCNNPRQTGVPWCAGCNPRISANSRADHRFSIVEKGY